MLICRGRLYMSCANYSFSNNDCCCCWLEDESFKWGWGFDYTIVRRYFPTHPLLDKFKARGTYTPTHGLASTSRMRTAISPGQWQSWTAVSPLLGLISLSRIKMSKIQVNRQWSQSACILWGRPLKGKGKDRSAKGAQGKGKGTSPPQGQAYPSRFY